MKHVYLTLIFLNSFILSAQTFQIDWQENKTIVIKGHNYSIPYFSNKEFVSDQLNLPHFSLVNNSKTSGDWEIFNVQTENISNLGNVRKSDVPNKLTYDLRIVSGRGKKRLSLDLITIYNDGNQTKRITSFSIRQAQNRTPNARASSRFALDNSNNSVLRTGDWYKISIDTTGIFKIDYDFFRSNGIPTDFNPSNLKIFGNGGALLHESPGNFRYGALQENAILVQDGGDGSFDPGDYALFYAQGPHTFDRRQNNLENIRHRFNIYEEKSYYYINFDGGLGKRVSIQNSTGTPIQTFTTFDDYQYFEEDLVNLNNLGRQWLGNDFSLENSRTYTFNAPFFISSEPVTVDYRFVSSNARNNNVSIDLGGVNVGNFTINFGNNPDDGLFVQNQGSNTINSPSLNVTVNVDNSANPSGLVYLDFLRVKYKQHLNFNGNQLRFRNLSIENDGSIYGFQFSNTNMEYIWDVSDITNAKQVELNGNRFNYSSNSPYFVNEFVAFNSSDAYLPEFESQVANQNIRNLSNIDYIVVTYPAFLSEANRIANYHQTNGLNSAVVTTDQVYNEYGSGSSDLTAIRDFFKHLYSKGNLQYALLFGSASYDFKDRIPNNTNFVPSFQSFNSLNLTSSFVTDDYLAILDEETENITSEFSLLNSSQLDIAVGRFPATNTIEAKVMVDKTLAYYNSPESFGDWRTKIDFVVDDDDCGNPFDIEIDDNSANFLETTFPEYTIRKRYLDAFSSEITSGGRRYPAVEQAINSSIQTGSLLVNYFGHGSPTGWAQERVLVSEELRNYNNFNQVFKRLPVIMTITCDFAVWDLPQIDTDGETFLTNPEGGSALMLTTSRAIGVEYGKTFNTRIIDKIFEYVPSTNQFLSVAEALRVAKIEHGPTSNHFKVNILGDPALSLARPPREVRLTKINGEDAATFNGVLRALDFVEFEGEVLNAASNLDTSFNGTVTATLFDKPVTKRTLNNRGCFTPFEFSEQINAIFRGNTEVTNGTFKIQFYVPKDINYTIGNGKLLLYAENNIIDAVGSNNQIQVGDLNPDGIDDDQGPVIGLYMNNLNFVNGGITNRDPYILACLNDDTGINATGIGIGHDITGVLNEDIEGTIVMNDFFDGGDNDPCVNSALEDYQKGRVFYHLQDLELGEYTLNFRAWDINNNSSTETLDFVVLEDGSQQIFIEKLLNWPNPFTNQTYFHFEHNCDSELEVLVQIFTVSGKIVKTIQQTVSSEPWLEGYRTGRFEIPWDGLDDFGNKIGKGVYIYKATVRGTNSDTCSGSASEIEKLVILK